ncbi:MAG: hypothetical protein ACI4QP_07685, partial [Candidatus Enteromonas sp.]
MERIENISETIREGKKNKKAVGFQATKWIVFVIFAVYAVSLLLPFLWMLLNSFKDRNEFYNGNVWGFPKQWQGLNFIEVLQYKVVTIGGTEESVFEMVLWSILTTVLGTIINVFLSAAAAYVLVNYRFPGRNLIYGAAIFAMVTPIVGTLPAQVNMMEFLHLDNSLLG